MNQFLPLSSHHPTPLVNHQKQKEEVGDGFLQTPKGGKASGHGDESGKQENDHDQENRTEAIPLSPKILNT